MCLAAFAGSVGCRWIQPTALPSEGPEIAVLPGQSTGVFTTAYPSFGAAVNDFFNRRPEAVQPIEFPHDIHVGKAIVCSFCRHEGVDQGPVAGIPGVRTCMICHEVIATDTERIQQITALRDQGLDIPWQRVYGFSNDDHVRFNHAPHIRAEVECETCHGDVGQQTVAQRSVEHTMRFCVDCHREREASIDCLTCHF